jgi:hypothetical protein
MRVSQRSPSTEFSHWAFDRLKANSRNCFMPAASSLIFGHRHGIEIRVFRAFDFHGLRRIGLNEFMVLISGAGSVPVHWRCSDRPRTAILLLISFRWDLRAKTFAR